MFWFAAFCLSIYYCVEPPTHTVEVPNGDDLVGTHYETRAEYPYWSHIVAAIIFGLIWFCSYAAWREQRNREHDQAMAQYESDYGSRRPAAATDPDTPGSR